MKLDPQVSVRIKSQKHMLSWKSKLQKNVYVDGMLPFM